MCSNNCTQNKLTLENFQKIIKEQKLKIVLGMYLFLVLFLYDFSPFLKPVFASEGGTSSFTPGSQGDFGMNYFPPGLYFKENIIYTEGTLKNYPAAVQATEAGPVSINAKLDAKIWFDLFQISYSSNTNILGGRYVANINIPLGFDANLRTKASIPAAPELGIVNKTNDTTSGLGDIQVIPFGLIWDKNDLHFLAAQNFVLTTGRYDVNETNNLGRNYFSYDELVGITWLDETNGHELSFMAGYMINTKNQATDYKTGDEFHVDYTLAQYLSRQFGLGIVGYYYKQMTDDDSPVLDEINAVNSAIGLPTPDGYKSKGAAIGPALMYTPNIGGKDVSIIVKWLYEFSMTDRLEGDWVYISAVLNF
jgi:hypothetical protein